ncbi:MAG: hypothetical protein QOE44_2377, partial [Solirubrobacteraceae bacterium]|nr:hypothetical protein [Solirubrobacteraceae bacterium]
MVRFRRLLPAGEPVDAAGLLDGLDPGLRAPAGRPHLA